MPPNGSPPARRRTSSSTEAPAGKASGADGSSRAPLAPPRRPSTQGARAVSPPAAPANAAKLVCTAGPKAGTEFPLSDDAVVIGRAVDATLSIPDTSVSRRHVQLTRVPGGWSAADLGSGNGTQVNGETIEGEVRLHNGDVITIGDTELSFVDVENATDKRPLPARRTASAAEVPVRRPPPGARPRVVTSRAKQVDPDAEKRKKRLTMYGVLGLLLLVMFGAGYKIQQKRKLDLVAVQERRDAEHRAQLSNIFQEGKNLVRQGNWKDAQERFAEVKRLQPNYPAIDDYLKAADKEIPNQEQLAATAEALKQNKVAAAAEALGKVSADTQQFQALANLKRQLEDKVIARITEAQNTADQARRVSTATDVSKWQETQAITQDILAAFPDNRDAKVLNQLAIDEIARLTKPKVVAPPPPSRPWERPIQLFVAGDVTGAFDEANRCAGKASRCKQLLGEMTDFQTLYKKMEDLDAKGLQRLLELDKKITEGRGPSQMARNAGTRASNIFYKSAAAAKAAGQNGRALEYAMKALSADPGHSGAQAIVNDLKQKAKDLYLLAYSIKDTNIEDAVSKFKEVLAMTPPDDETHQKAKRRIEELAK